MSRQILNPIKYHKLNAWRIGPFMVTTLCLLALLSLLSQNVKGHHSSSLPNSSVLHASHSSQNCFGNETCISKIQENFKNTGKTILGEGEYMGNGNFGISYLDAKQSGFAYHAIVKTDCNCNVVDLNISKIR